MSHTEGIKQPDGAVKEGAEENI